jgi:hypothetical protein
MRILNTITATRYSSNYNAHVEKTYSLIRPYVLTCKGAAKALKNEHPEMDTKNLTITHIQTSIYCR